MKGQYWISAVFEATMASENILSSNLTQDYLGGASLPIISNLGFWISRNRARNFMQGFALAFGI